MHAAVSPFAFMRNSATLTSTASQPAAEQRLRRDRHARHRVHHDGRRRHAPADRHAAVGRHLRHAGFELLAVDGTSTFVLASETNAITPIVGEFVDASFTINSRLISAQYLGKELRVRLSMPNSANGVSVEFDDVRLTAFERTSEWDRRQRLVEPPAQSIGATPAASNARMTFRPAITAPRTISFASPKSAAAIGFDGVSVHLSRSNTLTLASPTASPGRHDFRGSHAITAPVVLGAECTRDRL
ncbi:MAG: hypothetical protein QM751_07620 [Paludibacteraceae bacterium]